MQQPHDASRIKHQPVGIGLLVGMAAGMACAFVLELPFALGLGLGMFIGVTIGIAMDRDHPRRSRILWTSFALSLLSGAVLVAAFNMSAA